MGLGRLMKNKWAMYGVGALITGFVMENKQPIRTGPGLILKKSPHPCYMFMGAQYIYYSQISHQIPFLLPFS